MTNRAVAVRVATEPDASTGAVGLALLDAARVALAPERETAPDENARAPFTPGARPVGWGFRSGRNV